ncbi:hypothetical protein BD0104_13370 [Helicobacter pylori]
MFQPLLDAFIESAPIKKKIPLNPPPPPPKNKHLQIRGGIRKNKKKENVISCKQNQTKTLYHQTPEQPTTQPQQPI